MPIEKHLEIMCQRYLKHQLISGIYDVDVTFKISWIQRRSVGCTLVDFLKMNILAGFFHYIVYACRIALTLNC